MADTKLKKIIFILKELHKRKETSVDATIDSYDEVLIEEFDIFQKQLGRLLDDVVDTTEEIK